MDVAHGEMVEKELNAMLMRRARKGDVVPDEKSELWRESVERYNARIREENRLAWCSHHQGQAVRLRAVLGELATHHEEQAAKLMDVRQEGAA
jgi:hypothetical protein